METAKEEVKYRLVDLNGEIVGSINQGDHIIRKSSVVKLEDTQKWTMKHFYKGNIDEIRKQMNNLDVYEKALIYSIATYIGYEDCCLKYDNGRQMDFDGIVEVSGISRGKVSSTINSLVSKDMLGKAGEGGDDDASGAWGRRRVRCGGCVGFRCSLGRRLTPLRRAAGLLWPFNFAVLSCAYVLSLHRCLPISPPRSC